MVTINYQTIPLPEENKKQASDIIQSYNDWYGVILRDIKIMYCNKTVTIHRGTLVKTHIKVDWKQDYALHVRRISITTLSHNLNGTNDYTLIENNRTCFDFEHSKELSVVGCCNLLTSLIGKSTEISKIGLELDKLLDYDSGIGFINKIQQKRLVKKWTKYENFIMSYINDGMWQEPCHITPRVYLAGSCSKDKRELMKSIATALFQHNYDVYCPFDLKIENAWSYTQEAWSQMVFEHDKDAIDTCDIFLMISAGRNSSAGTNWEQGYAYALGKRVLVAQYTEDETSLMTFCGCNAFMNSCEANIQTDVINLLNGTADTGKCTTVLT